MDFQRLKGNVLLVFTAIIWGTAFVFQEMGMDHVGPFTFLAVRNFVGALAVLPVAIIIGKIKKKKAVKSEAIDPKAQLKAGIFCGVALFFGAAFQQIGMALGAEAGKAGFITTLYILAVPVLGLLFKKRVRPVIWACIATSLVGLYFLCIPQGGNLGSVNLGDVFLLLGAVAFGAQILAIDHFATKVESTNLAWMQFLVCAMISAVFMFALETPTIENIMGASSSILYTGLMSSGVAFTLQIIAQKYTRATDASLIMSLESVFAMIAGAIMLMSFPTGREMLGSTIMLAAILIAQLPEKQVSSEKLCEKHAA